MIHTPPSRSVAPGEVLYQRIKRVRAEHIDAVVDQVRGRVIGSNMYIPDLCASDYEVTYNEPKGGLL